MLRRERADWITERMWRSWRAEGLIDLAAWVDGDRLKSIELNGEEEDEGDMPSTGGTSGPMAVKRPDGAGGI